MPRFAKTKHPASAAAWRNLIGDPVPPQKNRRVSCPECGFIYDRILFRNSAVLSDAGDVASLDCPRCQCHYTLEEFARLLLDTHSERCAESGLTPDLEDFDA